MEQVLNEEKSMQSITEQMTTLKNRSYQFIIAILFFSVLVGSASAQTQGDAKADHVETIVVIRHGEKPHGGLGQLSCQGLNRGLALPTILIEKYGTPNFIFAPNPVPPMHEGGDRYAYVRPLVTIEPTAIQLGLPVNASFGFDNLKDLQKELTSPKYSDAVVFVSWEHIMAQHFAENLMASFGGDVRQVPEWPGNDYDSIYVLRLTRTGKKTSISFTHDQEGLDHKLPKTCPSVSPI